MVYSWTTRLFVFAIAINTIVNVHTSTPLQISKNLSLKEIPGSGSAGEKVRGIEHLDGLPRLPLC